MEVKIVLKGVRIYLQNRIISKIPLVLKVLAQKNIQSIKGLTWNRFCNRWENKETISLDIQNAQEIKFEVSKHQCLKTYKRLFQGKIQLQNQTELQSQELKICLSSRGRVMGWLYCQLFRGHKLLEKQQHFLNIHRLTIKFLDMRDEDSNVSVYLNNSLIFMKDVYLRMKKRILFPNIKQAVKKSDLLILSIDSRRQKGRYNIFLVDHLQSGNTALLKAWVRNGIGNKMGDFEIEYFLQNFYLPNSDPEFQPQQMQNTKDTKETRIQETLTNKQRQDLRLEVVIDSFKEIESKNCEKSSHPLLRKVILGQRRRRNLVYYPDNCLRVKKKPSLQIEEILQDS